MPRWDFLNRLQVGRRNNLLAAIREQDLHARWTRGAPLPREQFERHIVTGIETRCESLQFCNGLARPLGIPDWRSRGAIQIPAALQGVAAEDFLTHRQSNAAGRMSGHMYDLDAIF